MKICVTQAASHYRTNRQYIYRWLNRYDGTLQSLADRSHRPHHHPNQHTEEELTLIWNMRRRNPNTGLVVLWVKLRQRGYTRSISGLYRVLIRNGQMAVKFPNPKYIPKPYEQMQYPGQRVQIDVKFVPEACLAGEAKEQKYYQYTAVDECTRFCFREMYDEHSAYSSLDFLKKLIEFFPFPIREIQTDNGTEWTNALLVKTATHKTLFENYLEENGIIYHRIRVATPRHNGKVERQHRIDEKRFYNKMKMYSLEDGRKQIAKYNKVSNKISKCCLNYRSIQAVLENYLAVM